MTNSGEAGGLSFRVIHKGPGRSRVGEIRTPHGCITTPTFFFCATKGTLKGLSIRDIREEQTPVLLANTYHLMLRPGAQRVAALGGLHRFMGWDGPLFTDSGGFQIFCLGHGSVSDEIKGRRTGGGGGERRGLLKITEEGALFISYIDGKREFLSPERAIEVQCALGADLMCVLDECTPFHVSHAYTARSMEMSHRWEKRSLEAFGRYDCGKQGLYGIVQGGIYEQLRHESCDFVSDLPFFGQAIGGCLGSTKEQMRHVVGMTMARLRDDRPTHLLGIGGVDDIIDGIREGIDTFDCVSPTRLGRHGGALVQPHYWKDASESTTSSPRGSINLSRSHFRDDPRPIDEHCPCHTCRTYSRAYLHHLVKSKEILSLSALSIHNVSFMNRFMRALQQGIRENDLERVIAQWRTPESL